MITMLLRACRHTMIANAARFAYMIFAMPRLACSRGVPNTAKMATTKLAKYRPAASLITVTLDGADGSARDHRNRHVPDLRQPQFPAGHDLPPSVGGEP